MTNHGARYETLRAAAAPCSIRETLCLRPRDLAGPAARVGSEAREAASPASCRRPPSKLRLFAAQPVRGTARITGRDRSSLRQSRSRTASGPVALAGRCGNPPDGRAAGAFGASLRVAPKTSSRLASEPLARLETNRSDGTVAVVKAVEIPIFETFDAGSRTPSRQVRSGLPRTERRGRPRAPVGEGFCGGERCRWSEIRLENVSPRGRRTRDATQGEDRMREAFARRMLVADGVAEGFPLRPREAATEWTRRGTSFAQPPREGVPPRLRPGSEEREQ